MKGGALPVQAHVPIYRRPQNKIVPWLQQGSTRQRCKQTQIRQNLQHPIERHPPFSNPQFVRFHNCLCFQVHENRCNFRNPFWQLSAHAQNLVLICEMDFSEEQRQVPAHLLKVEEKFGTFFFAQNANPSENPSVLCPPRFGRWPFYPQNGASTDEW